MKVDRLPMEGSKLGLRVEVGPEEYREAGDKGVRAFLASADAPVPEDADPDQVLAQLIGGAAAVEDVKLDLAVNYLVPHAVQQAGIVPVCSPEFGHPTAPEDGKPFVFEIGTFPKPSFELSSYEPVSIEIDAPVVTEEEVDGQIDAMAQQAAVVQTDIMTGEPKRVAPEVTDEWVKENVPDPAIDTVAELRVRMRRAGEEYKAEQFEQYKMSMTTAEAAKRLSGEIPADMVAAMKRSMMEELQGRLQSQGMTVAQLLEQQGMTEDQLEYDAERNAVEMLRQSFALDAVYRHDGLEIGDEDVMAALSAIAPGQEKEAEASMRESGYLFTVEETARRMKAGKHILEQAKVKVSE